MSPPTLPPPIPPPIPYSLAYLLQVFFVASDPEYGSDSADMIATQYLQRVMSVQRAIETANFTSNVDGQVCPSPHGCVCVRCGELAMFSGVSWRRSRAGADEIL